MYKQYSCLKSCNSKSFVQVCKFNLFRESHVFTLLTLMHGLPTFMQDLHRGFEVNHNLGADWTLKKTTESLHWQKKQLLTCDVINMAKGRASVVEYHN